MTKTWKIRYSSTAWCEPNNRARSLTLTREWHKLDTQPERETKNLTKIRFYSLTNIYIFKSLSLSAGVPGIEMIRLKRNYSYFCFATLQAAKIVKHLHKLANCFTIAVKLLSNTVTDWCSPEIDFMHSWHHLRSNNSSVYNMKVCISQITKFPFHWPENSNLPLTLGTLSLRTVSSQPRPFGSKDPPHLHFVLWAFVAIIYRLAYNNIKF